MERQEKGEEKREGKKKQQQGGLMAKKLRRGVLVGKRGGGPSCTTPPPRWRLKEESNVVSKNDNKNKPSSCTAATEFEFLDSQTTPTVSARKLCANLWDIESHQKRNCPLPKMLKGLRRRHHKNGSSNGFRFIMKNPLDLSHVVQEDDEPATASSLGRTVSALLIQYHRSLERNDRALQPPSPASYGGSSMEVGPYKHAVTPSSSLDFRVRMGGSSYSLKTSTELLKVLNRIWSLEEQHASNACLVKELKMELDHSRAKIKELLLEQQSERQEMDELMKQVTDNKLFRKSIEQDRIRAAVQSVCDELEDERKLRKRSEGLHRKLARELSELNSSFANALRELERERKARILLENLCDEFAKGISDYEQELLSLKHKPEKVRGGVDKHDRLILHISEAWLDERMQMKLAEAENNIAEKITIVDKLGFDIATFLQAKQAVELRKRSNLSPKEHCLRRHSLESFPLNEAVSAPQHPAEEESTDVDSHSLQASKRDGSKQSKSSNGQHSKDATVCQPGGLVKSNSTGKKVESQELIKGNGLSNFKGQFEQHMRRAMSCNGNKTKFLDKDQVEMGKNNLEAEEDLGIHGLKSNLVLDNLIRNRSLSTEGNKLRSEICCREDSCMQSLLPSGASPVQKWKSEMMFPDFEKSESSLRWPRDLDENSLMTQLIEARLERRRQSHSKPAKGSFWF